MNRASTRALRVAGPLVALSLFLSVASGGTCLKHSGNCSSATTLRVHNGSPTVPCQPGHPVVRIDSQASCPGGNGGPVRVYRCGTSSAGFSYTGTDGTVHSFSVLSNWENALENCKDELLYTAS